MDGDIIRLAHKNDNPKPAEPVASTPVPEVVKKLELLLEEAKAGHIQAIAIAAWTDENSGKSTFYTGEHFFSMIGAVSWLGARLNKILLDD